MLKTALIYVIFASVKRDLQNLPINQQPVYHHHHHHHHHHHRVREEIVIIGDSIIKHVNGREISQVNLVKTRCHPEATTEELPDCINPTTRKKTDMVIIHTRSGSRTAATSKMEFFVIIVNGFQPFNIITKC